LWLLVVRVVVHPGLELVEAVLVVIKQAHYL
jgi:hypothetical protein